jgi:hypothetical protein
MSATVEKKQRRINKRHPVLRIERGNLSLTGTDHQNTAALLSAARGTLISLMMMLESAESLLLVDALEMPRQKAEQLDCLLLTAIEENRRAS